MTIWKGDLGRLLGLYLQYRKANRLFFAGLFCFFVIINLACYWWAMVTAFPDLCHGSAGAHYFKVQFPVGILGALFDSLSFFVTIYIVRRALQTRSVRTYIGHLSLDFVIAVIATFWVLFVFSFSGWLIYLFEDRQVSLMARNAGYLAKPMEALERPTENIRNIYFGLIMGMSAMLPTCLHISLFFKAVYMRFRFRNHLFLKPQKS